MSPCRFTSPARRKSDRRFPLLALALVGGGCLGIGACADTTSSRGTYPSLRIPPLGGAAGQQQIGVVSSGGTSPWLVKAGAGGGLQRAGTAGLGDPGQAGKYAQGGTGKAGTSGSSSGTAGTPEGTAGTVPNPGGGGGKSGVAALGGATSLAGAGGASLGSSPIEAGHNASISQCASGENSFTHQLDWGSGTGRVLMVGALVRGTPSEFDWVTYAGVPMTQLTFQALGEGQVTLYQLLDADLPSSAGSYSVVAFGNTQTFGCVVDAASFRGVRQVSAPSATYVGTQGTFTKGLSPSTTGAFAYDFVGAAQGAISGPTVQTILTSRSVANLRGVASYRRCEGTAPCEMTWTVTGSNSFAWAMALLEP